MLNTNYLNQTGDFISSSTDKGLGTEARSMIAKYNNNYSTWHLRGGSWFSINTLNVSEIYEMERTTGNIFSNTAAIFEAPIGILYVSDYLYTIYDDNHGYNNSDPVRVDQYECSSVTWLNGYIVDTIFPSGNMFVCFIYYDSIVCGDFVYEHTGIPRQVLPILYLEHTVKIRGGNGSQESPYILTK